MSRLSGFGKSVALRGYPAPSAIDPEDALLHRHCWDPPAGVDVKSQGIYLLHGIGEHGARYERLATRLASRGYRVASHDHSGHGQSSGPRGVADPPELLVTEAGEELERFTAACGSPPYLFGHSLGGVVAMALVLSQRVPIAGLLLSAPAIVPRLSATDRLKLQVMSILAPTLALDLPYDASRLTQDVEEIAKAEGDELIHGFKSAGLVGWLMATAEEALERAGEIDVATLLLVAGSDMLIDTELTMAFAERIPSTLLTLHRYDGFHHELLNETPDRRTRVMVDIENWLERVPD